MNTDTFTLQQSNEEVQLQEEDIARLEQRHPNTQLPYERQEATEAAN
jgi:hypothetical protein